MLIRSYHVVVSRSLEHLVAESLTDLPCRSGAPVRSRCSVETDHEVKNSNHARTLDEDHNDDTGDMIFHQKQPE